MALQSHTAIDQTCMQAWQDERVVYCTGDVTWMRLIDNALHSIINLDAEFNACSYTVKKHAK